MAMPLKTVKKARKLVTAAKAGKKSAIKKVAKSAVTYAAKKGTLAKEVAKDTDSADQSRKGGQKTVNTGYDYEWKDSRTERQAAEDKRKESRAVQIAKNVPGKSNTAYTSSFPNQKALQAKADTSSVAARHRRRATRKVEAANLSNKSVTRAIKKGTKQGTKVIKQIDKGNAAAASRKKVIDKI